MAEDMNKLDQVVLEARRNAEKRAQGYREQALKLFPWVCGGCARTVRSYQSATARGSSQEQQS